MTSASLVFLCYTVIAIVIQGVFALFEMACISFNKVRLQYYVSLGKKRALWVSYLLNRPSRLFGTTLIVINSVLEVGSECARRFYESVHLNPDWSPITQVILVVVFAELAPLFAAHRHPEQAAMFLSPIMAFIARLLFPVTWSLGALSRLVQRLMKQPTETPFFLSLEEVKMAFEEKEGGGTDEFNKVAARIFQLKNWTVNQLMIPLKSVQMAPTSATAADIRHLLAGVWAKLDLQERERQNRVQLGEEVALASRRSVYFSPFVPIYHKVPHNIIGVAHLRDLLRIEDVEKVISHTRSPWFVAEKTSILDILDQFRRNNQSVAIVLDLSGQSCGLLSLSDITSSIFGPEIFQPFLETTHLYVERTLSGDMDVAAFNREFQSNLPLLEGDTLSDFLVNKLEHLPVIGETVRVGSYLFTIKEPSMRGVKTLTVSTSKHTEKFS